MNDTLLKALFGKVKSERKVYSHTFKVKMPLHKKIAAWWRGAMWRDAMYAARLNQCIEQERREVAQEILEYVDDHYLRVKTPGALALDIGHFITANYDVCEMCHGTGTTMVGEFDDIREVKCPCLL